MSTQQPQRLTDYGSVDLEVRRVAGGGFGLVFMGPERAGAGGRWRALKTLRPELLDRSPRARDLFVRECLVWCGLWPHPNLLTAESITEIDGRPYLFLDYAERGSLRELLAIEQPFATRVAWAQDVAAGLAALHAPDPTFLRPQPLVHRDLKPENVLVMADGRAAITDFGLAKAVEAAGEQDPSARAALLATLGPPAAAVGAGEPSAATRDDGMASRALRTARGVALGTPAYMAPEQWDDAATAGPPADCYALGLILSELLAGRHALLDLGAGHGTKEWERAHRAGRPWPLREGCRARAGELPVELERLYAGLLAKRWQDRPAAAEALTGLQRAAAALGEAPYHVPDAYPHTPEHEMMHWHNWSVAFECFGLYEEAMECNERALALAPGRPSALLARASILQEQGRTEEALAAYAAALAATPADDQVGRKIVHYNQGTLLCEAGRHAEAEVDYAAALALIPEDASAWGNRAANERDWCRAEAAAGRGPEARAHCTRGLAHVEHALTLNPNHPQLHQFRAELRAELARLGG